MVNRKNWTPSHHAKLCQDHFECSCFVSDPTVLDSMCFKPGRLRLKKPSAVDRIVPTIFPRVELRTDLSLLCTGFTPLKPSLAITKRTNLKLLEESAADDIVPTSVEEVVIQPTFRGKCC
ncbi:uncharacterized protein LOC143245930 [Tachypleus tridentatus]|uniref:uncharacterized protein LOC143245930 n=1 Tax=Tachypleus tridentatus TaxID=6853 RepID=UPI003FD57479